MGNTIVDVAKTLYHTHLHPSLIAKNLKPYCIVFQQTMAEEFIELSLHTSSPGRSEDVIAGPRLHAANTSDESLRGPQALPHEHNIPDGAIEVESQQFSTCSCRGACNCHHAGSYLKYYGQ